MFLVSYHHNKYVIDFDVERICWVVLRCIGVSWWVALAELLDWLAREYYHKYLVGLDKSVL